jgi:predicted acylesterase/phospholipase RssA
MGPTLDLIFSGGGTRGVALAGAMDVLEQRRPRIRRLVGTSAGAIAAAFGAAGLTARDYLKLVPERENDPFYFNSFFAAPPGEVVRAAAAKKDSQTRLLLRGAVDGAIENMFKGLQERRPRIGEFLHAAFASRKDALYENAFLGFLERAALKEDPARPRPRTALFALIEFGGLYDPNLFRDWLPQHLGRVVPLFDGRTTFKQFHDATRPTGRELSVVVTDATSAQTRVLNHRTTPDCPVVEGVLMSMCVPLVWPEVEWRREWGTYLGEDIDGHLMIDGAVLANFPIHLLIHRDSEVSRAVFGPPENKEDRPEVLGLLLDDSKAIPGDVTVAAGQQNELKILERINRLIGVFMSWQTIHVEEAEPLICHIPCKGHPALEMTPSAEAILRLQALVNSGRCAMTDYLKKRKLF